MTQPSLPDHLLSWIVNSIPIKLSLIILCIESFMLALLGTVYVTNFYTELERAFRQKLVLPARLVTQHAIPLNKVTNRVAITEIIEEEVDRICILSKTGHVIASDTSSFLNRHIEEFLDAKELPQLPPDRRIPQPPMSRAADDRRYASSLNPITLPTGEVGRLYLRVHTERLEKKKQKILILFITGSLLTILLTTLPLALFLKRLIVPRINDASQVLEAIASGNLAHRISLYTPLDEIGKLMILVNAMLDTLNSHLQKQRILNEASACFGNLDSMATLHEEAVRLVCRLFDMIPGKSRMLDRSNKIDTDRHEHRACLRLENSSPGPRLLLTIPLTGDQGSQMETPFIPKRPEMVSELKDSAFITQLDMLINNTTRRLAALEEIIKAEAKYRHIFTTAVEGIFQATLDGRFLEVNPALAAMTGYDSPQDMIDSVTDIGSQCYVDKAARQRLLYHLRSQGKINDHEVLVLRKDGTSFPAAVSGHLVEHDGDHLIYEGRVVNIEERKLRESAERRREAAEAVANSQKQLLTELELNKQLLQNHLEEKEVLLREICHRTKNNMLVIISMLRLQAKSIGDPAARSVFNETENRIRAMSLVHEKLYRSENLAEIDLAGYLEEMISTLISTMVLNGRIKLIMDASPVAIVIDTAVPLGLAVNEIVTNAIKHAFPDNRAGTIQVRLRLDASGQVHLTIKDDGVGLPPGFNLEQLTSYGVRIATNIVEKQLQGSCILFSDGGTTARIRFAAPGRMEHH